MLRFVMLMELRATQIYQNKHINLKTLQGSNAALRFAAETACKPDLSYIAYKQENFAGSIAAGRGSIAE